MVNMQLVTEFKNSLFNDDVTDLCIDLTEIGIDSVMDEGVLSEVPIAKTIVALGKTGLALRERNMLKQTLTFIRAFNSETISDEQLQKYKDKISNNKYAEKELGRVLYLLDRNIDEAKSAILGKIYNAYVNGKIGWDRFCELSEVNERMLISDYRMLLSDEKMQYTNGNYAISRLIALGIMVEREAPNASRTGIEMFCKLPKSDVDSFNRSDYQITSLGKELTKYVNVDFSE
jgi:hypothetical protein